MVSLSDRVSLLTNARLQTSTRTAPTTIAIVLAMTEAGSLRPIAAQQNVLTNSTGTETHYDNH